MVYLRQLEIDTGNIDGARAKFQKLILHLVGKKYGSAYSIRPCPGDWGIDVIVGKLTSGTCLIWQAKYFIGNIGASQKKQIEDSFKQLIKKSKEENFKVNAWFLCIPCTLSPRETIWWEKWKKKKSAETSIRIELMNEKDIEEVLMTSEAADIRSEFFPSPGSQMKERIIQEIPTSKASEYENSLFIKKLVLAGITENMSARAQFFNAELIQKEIHDKADENEMGELKSLYQKIHSMWETRFIQALQSSNPEAETRKVYSEMQKSIEKEDKGILNSPRILASFFHKQGFMHQLADICKVGWTPDFHKLDKKND